MTQKSPTPLQLFKVLMSILIYVSASAAWLLFGARHLISSTSDIEVLTGFLGTAAWMITSACLFLFVTKPKPGQAAKTTEKDQ